MRNQRREERGRGNKHDEWITREKNVGWKREREGKKGEGERATVNEYPEKATQLYLQSRLHLMTATQKK